MDFRPTTFDAIIGQENIKQCLRDKVASFNKSGTALNHMLFLGASGLGKTTLANAVASEMGVGFIEVMATRINDWDILCEIILGLKENDILFIDEIHMLTKKIQTELYEIIENFTLKIYNTAIKQHRKIEIPRFTLIGATTHAGDLNPALMNRFKYTPMLQPYTVEQLTNMVTGAAHRIYNIAFPKDVATEMAKLCKCTARLAYNMLDNYMVMVNARVKGEIKPSDLRTEYLTETLRQQNIDPLIGLDRASRAYLVKVIEQDGAVGAATIAMLINEQEETVKNMIEPFLTSTIEITVEEETEGGRIQKTCYKGPMVKVTPRGRKTTEIAEAYLKICAEYQKNGWFVNEELTPMKNEIQKTIVYC